ncbi:MAG: zinc-ribbon domain-containing protein [Candidatus Riflebacteria bacterium]|nr:zinc-ribbon domain-containing protein [Candidatus Riflebacteria bacterium]
MPFRKRKQPGGSSRIIEFLTLVVSCVVILLAYWIFAGKIPKKFTAYYSYFYIFAIIAVLGILGEQLAITIVSFILPLLLGALTYVLKFKPAIFPVERWGESYSVLVVFSACFIPYLYYKLELYKQVGGGGEKGGGALKTRIDPKEAAKYKEAEKKRQQEARELKVEPAKGKSKESSDKEALAKKAEAEKDETPEERMAREISEMREELNRRSMKLTTTLMRIKLLAKSLNRDQVFENTIEVIAKGLSATRLQLLLNDEENKRFLIVKAYGMQYKEYKDMQIPHNEISMITYLLGQEINEITGGMGVLGYKECEMDPRTKGLVGMGTVKTLLAAPIYMDSKLFAVVNVEKMQNPDYTRDDQSLMATCTDVAGLAMKNAKLYAATLDDLVSTKKLSEEQLAENEKIKDSLNRIVSPSIADLILADPSALRLGGRKTEISIFFSDIRGFTQMSESMDPEDILDQLNFYFTRMTDILMELEGTLDKYVGDELMALFGAPVRREDDHIRAVYCAIRMMEALRIMQEIWKRENKPVMEIGIGINTGEVIAGYMGSEKQLSYTVIGDNVNLASRIMSIAEGMEILITRATYELVKDYFDILQKESVMLKGKSLPVEVFSVKGVKEGVDIETIIHSNPKAIKEEPVSKKEKLPESIPEKEFEIPSIAFPEGTDASAMKQNIRIEETPMLRCSNCGTENGMQEKFCSKCGMPIF